MFDIEKLATVFSQQLWLEISPQIHKEAWQVSRQHSNTTARCNAYLNYLCLHTFIPWLQGWLEEDLLLENDHENILVKLDIFQEQSLASMWEVVNGSAINLERVRLVLLPGDMSETDELVIPQEWVDILDWQADHYLAVQVNPEQSWLRLWGGASYGKIKSQGKYNQGDRTYNLPAKYLTEGLTNLLTELQPTPNQVTLSQPISKLSNQQAEDLLRKLSDRNLHNPRLAIDFQQWAALISNEKWRQELELYRRRGSKTVTAINLRSWLQRVTEVIEEGWHGVEDLLIPPETVSVRGVTASQPGNNPQELKSIMELLRNDRTENVRRQAAGVLGELGIGNPEVVQALEDLLSTSKEEETRWQAALSLGKVAPQHPQGGIRKGRLIDLAWQLEGKHIALVVALMPREDSKVGVWLELKSVGKKAKLPPGVKLALVISGEVYREVTARQDNEGKGDQSLQLRFYPPVGAVFEVRISIGETDILQSFVA